MKSNRLSEKASISIHAFLVLAALVIFAKIVWNFQPVAAGLRAVFGYIQPVTIGFVIAFLLSPILRFFENKVLVNITKRKLSFGQKRAISLAMTYLFVFAIVSLILWFVIPQFVHSLSELVKKIPDFIYNAKSLGYSLLDKLSLYNVPSIINADAPTLSQELIDSISTIVSKISGFVGSLLEAILTGTAGFATNIVQITLGFIVSVYFLSGKEKLFAQLKKIGFALFPQKTVNIIESILSDTEKIFSSYIIGAIIDSLIVGLICFLFMVIAGFVNSDLYGYSILIGVIIGVTNIIPYFGPFLGVIPSALILLSVSPLFTMVFLIFILVLQQIDSNIINPKIVGSSIGLSALWVVFSLMLFGGLFGIFGMLIGVPSFAVIYMLVKRYTNYLLSKKNLSTNTSDYT